MVDAEQSLSEGVTLNLWRARTAQREWFARPLSDRLKTVRKIRAGIARQGPAWTELFHPSLKRDAAGSLTSEIIPLAEACRFLELVSEEALAPQTRSSKGRPVWLNKVQVQLRREPFGLVLVVGPSNYPLLLPAVQCLQALVAGNAALLKPGRGATAVLSAFRQVAVDAGVPKDCLRLLPEDPSVVHEAVRGGCDKVVFTGSYEAGRAVLRTAAEHATPVVAELSGSDAAIVLASADLDRAAAAIAFGVRLNGGETCIAPQRVLAHKSVAARMRQNLRDVNVPIIEFATTDEAIRLVNQQDHALGATVFGAESEAVGIAEELHVGVVVINDMIVPTADPRVPFGGWKRSGYGRTRGVEGLLEMTQVKAITIQRARRLRHLEPLPANAVNVFRSYLGITHGSGLCSRVRALVSLVGKG